MFATSKSDAVRKRTPCASTGPDKVTETADAIQPLRTSTQGQREEQMYRLAEIFAAIFETLPDEDEPVAATMERAA
jgi:hypothetical protein